MLTKEDFNQIQKLFQKQFKEGLMGFWDEVLESALSLKADKSDLEKLATKEELTEVHHKVDSIDRKLESEISYRDRLEKRVVKVETKVGINK